MRLPVLLLLALATACAAEAAPEGAAGGGGEGGPGAPGGWGGDPFVDRAETPASPEALFTIARAALCDRLVRCEPKLDARAGPLFQPRACHPADLAFGLYEAQLAYEAASGAIAIDLDAAEACARALQPSRGCGAFVDELWGGEAACGRALIGRRAAGEGCLVDVACAPGQFCRTDLACPGRCAPLRLPGESCDEDTHCAGALDCEAGRCVEPPGEGARCAGEDCAAGLGCERDPAGGRSCLPPAPEGGACVVVFGRSPCDGDRVCVAEGDGARCGVGAPLGGDCSAALPCAPGGRCLGGACAPIAPPDGACDERQSCPYGFRCDGARCRPGPVLGEACEGGCVRGACIDAACVPREEGEPCTGALLTPLGECAAGRCSGGLGTGRCVAFEPDGGPCGADDACGPGTTCRTDLEAFEDRCLPLCAPP